MSSQQNSKLSCDLPEKFYVNYCVRNGDYDGFGFETMYHLCDKSYENFINFLKNNSVFKNNFSAIMKNMNYLSTAYIYAKDVNNGTGTISKEFLEQNYPDIIEELQECKYCVVGYALIYHDNRFMNKDIDVVDIIESRIKYNHIATGLLDAYFKQTEQVPIPDCIRPKRAVIFWKKYIDYCFTSAEDSMDLNKFIDRMFKNLSYENRKRIENGLSILFKYNRFCNDFLEEIDDEDDTYAFNILDYIDVYCKNNFKKVYYDGEFHNCNDLKNELKEKFSIKCFSSEVDSVSKQSTSEDEASRITDLQK